MIVLAIDSGIDRTGYAIFDKSRKHTNGFKYISSGLVQTSKSQPTETRLMQIHQELEVIIKKYKPQVLSIEQLFFFKNQKTVIRVAQAQGVVMLLASSHGLKLQFLTPLQIKSTITGYGQSDKKSVAKMLEMTLGLNGELKQDDQVDAIACGLAYCYINENFRI